MNRRKYGLKKAEEKQLKLNQDDNQNMSEAEILISVYPEPAYEGSQACRRVEGSKWGQFDLIPI